MITINRILLEPLKCIRNGDDLIRERFKTFEATAKKNCCTALKLKCLNILNERKKHSQSFVRGFTMSILGNYPSRFAHNNRGVCFLVRRYTPRLFCTHNESTALAYCFPFVRKEKQNKKTSILPRGHRIYPGQVDSFQMKKKSPCELL